MTDIDIIWVFICSHNSTESIPGHVSPVLNSSPLREEKGTRPVSDTTPKFCGNPHWIKDVEFDHVLNLVWVLLCVKKKPNQNLTLYSTGDKSGASVQ